jgi:hypothetical protein
MKARLPESLLGRGKNEHPLQSMSEVSATGNQMKTTRPEHFMRNAGGVRVFCKHDRQKSVPGVRRVGRRSIRDGAGRRPLTSKTFAKSDARRDL